MVSGEPGDEQPRGMTAEELTPIFHASRLVTHVCQRFGQVQITPISSGLGVGWQTDKDLAEELVGAHSVVIAGGILVPGPETIFVHNEPFFLRRTQHQAAQAPVADGQRLVHGNPCRLLIPKRKAA